MEKAKQCSTLLVMRTKAGWGQRRRNPWRKINLSFFVLRFASLFGVFFFILFRVHFCRFCGSSRQCGLGNIIKKENDVDEKTQAPFVNCILCNLMLCEGFSFFGWQINWTEMFQLRIVVIFFFVLVCRVFISSHLGFNDNCVSCSEKCLDGLSKNQHVVTSLTIENPLDAHLIWDFLTRSVLKEAEKPSNKKH